MQRRDDDISADFAGIDVICMLNGCPDLSCIESLMPPTDVVQEEVPVEARHGDIQLTFHV